VVVAALVLALLLSGAWDSVWELFSERERVQRAVDAAGPWTPAMYVLLLLAQAVVAPLPAPVIAVAGGYAFGAFEGFLLTWLGCTLGAAACFGLSRAFGRRFVSGSERFRGLDRRMNEHGAVVVFVLRLIPLISFDAISYAAGLSGIPFGKFLLATALGMAPGTFAFVYLGVASPGQAQYAVFAGLAVLGVAAYVYLGRRLRLPGRVE
jgi:uncharacterized membrane protein YdjX (TVP38/TMEM64 family)